MLKMTKIKGVVYMYKMVNDVGIAFIKKHGSDQLEDYMFQMIYKDNTYLHTYILVDFLQVIAKDYGPLWIYAINRVPYDKFVTNKLLYGEIVSEMHTRIVPYLVAQYGFEAEQMVMCDHDSRIYRNR